jgi:hypothetical protein
MKREGGRGCLVVWIACIGHEKIVQKHGMECIVAKAVMLPLFLKLWPRKTYEFVICLILSLEHLLALPKNIIVIIMTIIV